MEEASCLTKAIAVPKPGEIPPHEKFYYLELLRRAGWIDDLQDDAHIKLQVPDPAATTSRNKPYAKPVSAPTLSA